MVRQESVKAFEKYVNETLKRHSVTINGVEVPKNYVFEIKSLKMAKPQQLVICDNINYAAELACEINKSDLPNNYKDYLIDKFSNDCKTRNINPNEALGIDIIVF